MKLASLVVAAAACTACTTVAPQAEKIRITRDSAEVAKCKAIGSVASTPPYIMPGDDLKQIRNQALPQGADTILITTPRFVSTQGVTYKCGGS